MVRGYTAGWYDYRDREVCFTWWEGKHRRVDAEPFDWYFYVEGDRRRELDTDDPGDPLCLINGTELVGNHTRVYMSPDWNTRREVVEEMLLREIRPLEADVGPLNRYLTDKPVKFDSHPRILYFDFETDARTGFERIPEHRVLVVSYREWNWKKNRPKKKTKLIVAEDDTDRAEGDLLEKFLRVVAEHDLLVAWNGGGYDEPVLKGRCRWLGIEPMWRSINFLDQMQLFKKYYARDEQGGGIRVSFSLENISQRILGVGKVAGVTDVAKAGGNVAERVYNVWRFEPELMEKYATTDVDLMVELEEKERYIDAHRVQSHLCNRFLSTFSLWSGYLGDAFILRYGAERGIRFPTKVHKFRGTDEVWKNRLKKQQEKIEGAFVMDPVPGLWENVQYLDFASLYPSIIRAFNISPDTFIGVDHDGELMRQGYPVAANGAAFERPEVRRGIFPQVVEETLKGRAPHKAVVKRLEKEGRKGSREWLMAKHLSDAYKVLGNTLYGIMAALYLRFYNRDCGEAVTLTGKAIIMGVLELFVRIKGMRALYADTDGAHALADGKMVGPFVRKAEKKLNQWIVERNGVEDTIRLEHESTYRRLLFTDKKKRYFGIEEGAEDPDIKGFELVRSDSCKYARELQRRLIEYILFAKSPNATMAAGILAEWREHLYAGKCDPEDLLFWKAINKSIDSYKADTPHVRVARKMLADGREVFKGMKIPYMYTGFADGKLDASHPEDCSGAYDPNVYWPRVAKPCTGFLRFAFPDHDWKAEEAPRDKGKKGKRKGKKKKATKRGRKKKAS